MVKIRGGDAPATTTIAGNVKQAADSGAPAAQTQVALTDNTTGTADAVYSNVGTAVATGVDTILKSSLDSRLTNINNNFADTAQLLTQIRADVADLNTKLAAMRTALRNAGHMA